MFYISVFTRKRKRNLYTPYAKTGFPGEYRFLGAGSQESTTSAGGWGAPATRNYKQVGQSLETTVVIRTFSRDWNIYFNVNE